MLDSGALDSCISTKFHDTISRKSPLIAYRGVPCKVASNETMMPEGISELDLMLGVEKIDHQFIVFKELSSEVILGMDFFKAVSGTLSVSDSDFHSLQPLVPLSDYERL